MEHKCNYVSSRGLMKSCNVYSETQHSSIKYCTNLKYFSKPAKTPIIYINSSAIPHFAHNVFPNIKEPIILVTGDCDETMPNDLYQMMDFNKFINDDRIVKWFCQNWIGDHKKVTLIPIGLDYHTLSNRAHEWGPKTSPIDQELLLQRIKDKSLYFTERIHKCYANFQFLTTTRYGGDRISAFDQIPKNLVYYEPNKIKRLNTWLNQSQYTFVISPHGNGYDCHRTWEALCLGCIPIMKRSSISYLFEDLPVLIVENWEDISENLLHSTIEDFKTKEFNFEKLTLSYWTKQFNSIESKNPHLPHQKR